MSFPINELIPGLKAALEANSRVILEAPPGAGKTTQVPLALLALPCLAGSKIIMLEPRRVAARAAARYMALTQGEEVGQTVGYRVRMESRCGPGTRIEVVTEGVLTRMLQSDPALEGVGLVIFDEFHERSLQADLGLALCLESQAALRDDLRLLVMSATLEGMGLERVLGPAPTVRSQGRSYPVDKVYLPGRTTGRDDPCTRTTEAILKALNDETGSLLVFLPGQGEIRRVEQQLLAAALPGEVSVRPLYGAQSPQEQDEAIMPAPAGRRKVVLATNIAETSLTIEGVRVVVDSGLSRRARFDPGSGMTRLQTVTVSRASADQRAGRAGRTEAGICYRLWPEGRGLIAHAPAEIMEADLAPLALELALWGCHDPAQLAWLDPPPAATFEQARELLQRLQVLDEGVRVTGHGRAVAALPLHPRLAHMVLRGRDEGLGTLACDLAALLSEKDILPRSREVDLYPRLRLLRDGAAGKAEQGAIRRIKQVADQWRRRLDIGESRQDYDPGRAGLLLSYAYPDRIGRRRPGQPGRFLLANGRGAVMEEHNPMAAADYLVAAHLDGQEREARIFLAAELPEEELLAHYADQIVSDSFVRWDSREQAVQCRQQRRLGALVIEDRPGSGVAEEQLAAAMITGIREMGIEALPWEANSRNWRARVRFLHGVQPEAWPDLSDDRLMANLEHWLAPFLTGVSRYTQLQKIDLAAALQAMLDWPQQRQLDELAPTHISVPSGSRIALDYSQSPPVLAVRLQEMFGCLDTPVIGPERTPVVLHLLSPARRPVQVTRDLAGFWRGSYLEVKKELKGRYPKHEWPDDPAHAQPTARAKPRKR